MLLATAFGSSLAFALASVLQQQSAHRVGAGRKEVGPLFLLLALLKSPAWVIGVASDVAGYGLQALALHQGPMVVVQPVLAAGLFFAMAMAAIRSRVAFSHRDWLGAAGIVVGLSVFLAEGRPAAGAFNTSGKLWAVVMAGTLVPAVVLVLAGRRSGGRHRAALLALAAGDMYGLSAALTKTSAHLLVAGPAALFGSWQPYALVVVGIFGFVVGQEAFAAAELSVSLPLITVADPLVSVALGAGAFGEKLASARLSLVAEVAGLAVLLGGLYISGHSSLLAGSGRKASPDRDKGHP